ncbi:MAG TPA: DUF3710 domain-containing protein [Streptosporangiales bacterium]
MRFGRRRARQERAEELETLDEERLDEDAAGDEDDAAQVSDDLDEADDDAEDAEEARTGPWDASEPYPEAERFDLGAVKLPVVEGSEIQVRIEDDTVVAATVLHGESGLEIMVLAAPKTAGLWDDLRGEMIKGLKESGGKVAPVTGTFGRELVAEVPVEGPDGRQGTQHMRFVGIDGPRWFLRGAFSGRAVDEPRHAAPLEEVLRGVVVDRGQQAMAPRELVPLELPREAREALGLGHQENEPTSRFRAVRRAASE